MKTHHRIFCAIPFDSATMALYRRIGDHIRTRYRDVTIVVGSEQVGPSPAYSNIASFKAQNRELTEQFVSQIRQADIVIADLTHNNPNVHVELGIALMQNKNILRVTGRSLMELGFDIRNFEVRQYGDEDKLIEIIDAYCETFFKIKTVPISRDQGVPYFEERVTDLPASNGFCYKPIGPAPFRMRDGAVKVAFEILSADSDMDWFGVYFRAPVHPLMGGHLVYVRQNGNIELAIYPGPTILETVSADRLSPGIKELIVQFENDSVDAQIGSVRLQSDKLSHQAAGGVLQAAWHSHVKVHQAEMICRDTIDWN